MMWQKKCDGPHGCANVGLCATLELGRGGGKKIKHKENVDVYVVYAIV